MFLITAILTGLSFSETDFSVNRGKCRLIIKNSQNVQKEVDPVRFELTIFAV